MEDTGGDGGECPRCGGVIEVGDCGGSWSATKHGKRLTTEEYRAFKAEEDEEGVCPVCGEKGEEVTVTWPEDAA